MQADSRRRQLGKVRFGVIGADHPHVLAMCAGLLEAGADFEGCDLASAEVLSEHFPNVIGTAEQRLIEGPGASLIVTAAEPWRRAEIAICALRHGKHVLTAKPGCLSRQQLSDIESTARRSGKGWVVWFAERVAVRSVLKAVELVHSGRIGEVVQILGLGPHRIGDAPRADWFYDPTRAGGILIDLACHQIDQYLHLTRETDVSVIASSAGNHAHPEHPGFSDFGELLLAGTKSRAYARVDWYTPDGLTTWGDGRLFILGTTGYIEIRKYVDIGGRAGGDHLFLVDAQGTFRLSCDDIQLTFFAELLNDVHQGTETAMTLAHAVRTTGLAITAQELADTQVSTSAVPVKR